MPVHGPFRYLEPDENDLVKIKNIFSLVSNSKDSEKFKLCSGFYSRALQGGLLDLELRFLLLVICLESLYLPGDNDELIFKLSIRCSNMLNKYANYGNTESIFNKVKEIYKTRCDIIHTGKTVKLNNDIFNLTVEVVRISLYLYLGNRELFSKEKLDKILFENRLQ